MRLASWSAAPGPPAVNGTGITDLMHRVIKASTQAPSPAAEITLPGTPASVPAARRLVKDVLPGCPRADDLLLAVSELGQQTRSLIRPASTAFSPCG